MLAGKLPSAPRAAFMRRATAIEAHVPPIGREYGPVGREHGFGRVVVNSVVTLATFAISALMLVCAARADVRAHGATTIATTGVERVVDAARSVARP